jgi:hypothetical protein
MQLFSCTLHDVMEITMEASNARTLCSGEQLNAIARQKNFCYIYLKNMSTASNALSKNFACINTATVAYPKISQLIFVKMKNGPSGILMDPGKTDS